MRGENFLIEMDGLPEKIGFFQTIFVESNDPESAELEAVRIIRTGDLRELVRNEPNDPPMLYLQELDELESFEGIETLVQGRSFFPMDEPE